MGNKAEKKAQSAARDAVDQIEQAVVKDDPMLALKGITALLVGIADSLERVAVALEQRETIHAAVTASADSIINGGTNLREAVERARQQP